MYSLRGGSYAKVFPYSQCGVIVKKKDEKYLIIKKYVLIINQIKIIFREFYCQTFIFVNNIFLAHKLFIQIL